MVKIIQTVYERSHDAARAVLERGTRAWGFEVRLDALERAPEFGVLRAATAKPLVATRRGSPFDPAEARRALDAGFDLVDAELRDDLNLGGLASKTILSHHDFETVPDIPALIETMKPFGAAEIKIAVTPKRFDDDRRLLEVLAARSETNLTLFGMAFRGLYSRILAPFYGSSLAFVSSGTAAAPGQFPIDKGLAIWGDAPARPEAVFAVVGNPAGHSRSPQLHNPVFRDRGLPAAYSAIEIDRFEEVGEGLAAGAPFYPRGVSITAPFKEDAFQFARERDARITERAEVCEAINTLVRLPDGRLMADNTDIDGIAAAVVATGVKPRTAAILGGGGTARSAAVALRQTGAAVKIFARTPSRIADFAKAMRAEVAAFSEAATFDGDLLVLAVGRDAEVPLPDAMLRRGKAIVDVAYDAARGGQLALAREWGVAVADGMVVLESQAVAQQHLFAIAMGREFA